LALHGGAMVLFGFMWMAYDTFTTLAQGKAFYVNTELKQGTTQQRSRYCMTA
jgi:hypothetical protein